MQTVVFVMWTYNF